LNRKTAHIFRTLVATAIFFAFFSKASAGYYDNPSYFSFFSKANTVFSDDPSFFSDNPSFFSFYRFFIDTTVTDTIPYPIYDRYGDPYSNPNRNTFDFRDTAFIKRTIEYDPKTKQYYIIEKVGNQYYRVPTSFTTQDFLRLQGQKDEEEYFRRRSAMLADMNRRLFKPKFKSSKDWFNRIVGTGKVDIKPSGYVDILAGYQGQNIKNPTIPERARKNGNLDFDMNSQLQVDANIGDKLKLPINYNTLANFEFENQLNLNYQGKDDEIIKQFQLGNVNFTSKGTLIPGAQSLFGIKTQLQFGKLFITGVLANQRAQRQSLGLEGGSATQLFSLKADEYEENRHFLMAQYFRNNYNTAMKELPIVNSAVQILKLEVWVTNRNVAATTDTRDIVALMDLGESTPYNPSWGGSTDPKPSNTSNTLYNTLLSDPDIRNSALVQTKLLGLGMAPVQEFEKTFARKLQSSEYYFNPQIGFLSLTQPLQPDEILGIAFQFTYNGRVFQVGEFSQDVPPDTSGASQRVLFLKLLKATSQRTNLPIWDLMMKNVYSVGFGQLERQDFKLDLLYEEPSLGEKRYLPPVATVDVYDGQPLISLVNLDRLNNQNDPQPDGIFDFIEGYTMISSMSRVIFPVLEPFGRDIEYAIDPALRSQYVYYPLYDTIKAIAQTYANLNRFKLSGRSKSSAATGDYQLGFNIPRGSVTVTAGGQTLQENVDYEINYDLGTLRVINQAIISSGVPVNIQYENQAAFGIQQRNYMGLRLDYLANKKLTIGATVVRLGERPFFVKQSYGDDPIRNTMYGMDIDYRSNWPRLTKWLDKLPFYSTKEMSSISAYVEAAVLDPGHAPQIGKGNAGQVYIDDFEGTRSSIDLRFPLISWTLASTPKLFSESGLSNDLTYGYNRAKMAWYNIEPVLQEKSNSNNPLKNTMTDAEFLAELSNPRTRQVLRKEIFPQQSNDFGQGLLTTFDVAFYPRDKGPYNYDVGPTAYSAGVDGDGKLLDPSSRWGGIMRNIDQIDFETSNIEYIEFWLQNPFILNPGSSGGQLYFNLGNISEDILKDGKRQYENGLRTPTNNAPVDSTSSVWGKLPSNPLQVTNAFSNDPDDRQYQDVGLDGLTDAEERRKFNTYLSSLPAAAAARAQVDPSADNFKPYRDQAFDQQKVGILGRYKDINNPHGNSPIADNNSDFVNAFTQYPDAEELNRDNTLNEVEEYFQYKVDIEPNMFAGSNFITDVRDVPVRLADNSTRTEKWYLFRIPIKEYESKVGNIPDFKSIRFIRMFATGFADSVVMRFGKLELVRNQWRKFQYNVDVTGNYLNLPVPDPIEFNTLAVNLEENDQREPINYVIPPGIERQEQLSNNNVQLFLNEQSLSMQFCGLPKKEARGVFKTMNLDMRQYGRLLMFIHAESRGDRNAIADNDLTAVIRIGNDFQGNYYEVRIPLKRTDWFETDSLKIWPEENNLDFDLAELTNLKIRRNNLHIPPSQYYSDTLANGRSFAILGNPNLGEVRGILLAVENTNKETACAEVWFNELRFSHLDEKGGYAAIARIDGKLADLGSFTLAGTVRTRGFGTLEQRVNERSREDIYTFDLSANIDAGKLLPKKFGIQIPVYAGISRISSTPQYDAFDLDLDLKQKLKAEADPHARDSIRNNSQDVTTIKTINFTNVKKIKTDGKKPKIWSVSNIDFNYSYIMTQRHNPLIENDELRRTRGALGYNYAPQPKYIEPFKRLIKSKSKWLTAIKDINFNLVPSQISFRADVFRQFGATRLRNIGGGPFKIPETYNKYFTFDRFYILQWNFTRSISLDFTATNNARIDEPFGRIDTKEKKDSIRKNFFNGGRNTQYQHQATLTYNVPTQKIPFLDWTTLRASYATRYNWLAASLLARRLGNTLSNTQTRTINSELNFEQLYSKWKFLRAVNAGAPAGGKDKDKDDKGKTDKGKPGDKGKPDDKGPKPPVVKPGDKKININNEISKDSLAKMTPKERRKAKKELRKKRREENRKLREQKKNQLPEVGGAVRFIAGLATSLKRVGIQYTEDYGTTLPGYMDSTRILGYNPKSGQPGWDFLFGYQPDTNWINRFGAKGLLSQDTLMSAMIQQRYNQRLNITAQLSPIRDLNIDVNLDKTFDKQYSELYKDTSTVDNVGLTRLNPYALGSFSISYISYQTLFKKFDPNVVSETFKEFEANRVLLAGKLAGLNPYGAPADPNDPGYFKGYGRYAQDVVIPAFLAAYTGKDPLKVKLIKNSNPKLNSNPFSGLIPRPNWSITYNGLSKIPGLDKIFTNVTIRHGYHSTLSMNSFNTALLFVDRFRVGYPEFRDPLTGNYIPYFLVPNITIQEAFDPLIEVDMTFTNQLTTRIEFRKSRTLSLSLVDYQLAENRSTEITFGFNWRKKGMPIIKKIGKMKLDNDVTFRFDFSLRDDATANSKLDQGTSFGTAGQKVIRIAPSIDYILNKRVSLKLYFEQNRNIPKISNAFPITNTRAGLQVRISLAQ
jgi:cell surface protein SprA